MATVAAEAPDLRPLGIGEILDVAIKVYTRHAGTLFKLVTLVILPVQVVGLFVILSTIPDALAGAGQNPFLPQQPTEPVPTFDGGDIATFFAGTILVALLNFVGVTLATGASFKAIGDAYLGVTPTWRSSLRFSLRHLRSLLWVTFLVGLATGVGFIFCIAPGVWLWISFAIATPVLLTEGLRGTNAMSRSFNLVKNRWWQTFAVIGLAAFLANLIGGIIGGGVGILTFTEVGENVLLIQTLNAIATTIAAIIATPFQASVAAVTYFDLRVRKEGFDLQLLAQRMGTETPAEPRAALIPPPKPPPMFAPAPGAPPQPYAYTPPPPQYGQSPGASQQYPPPPPTYPGYQVQRTNSMAIASLILGILWLFWIGSLMALAFGYAGLRQIKTSGGAQTGRGIAIAGIILGWFGVAMLALIIILATAS